MRLRGRVADPGAAFLQCREVPCECAVECRGISGGRDGWMESAAGEIHVRGWMVGGGRWCDFARSVLTDDPNIFRERVQRWSPSIRGSAFRGAVKSIPMLSKNGRWVSGTHWLVVLAGETGDG